MEKINLKASFKKILAKIKAERDFDPQKVVVNPFRDWQRLISLWFVFILLILGAAVYLSWRINRLDVSLSPEEMSGAVQINFKLIEKSEKIIKDRASRFEGNRQSPPVSIDPSL